MLLLEGEEMKLGCAGADRSPVGVWTGVVVEPASSQGKTGGSRGGTAASTYRSCLCVYTCPNLPHWYNAPDGQESQEDAGARQSPLELCRTHWCHQGQ